VLYLVLILVVAAFGLLIAALTTAHTVWAWISVGISVFAAGLLVFDWLRGRRRVAATSAPRVAEQTPAPEAEVSDEPDLEAPVSVPAEPIQAPEPVLDDQEPGEEATDAADLLIVNELSVEVVVVDEHPRYHLGRCTWLGDKETIPLPVSEARQLGFTPCARCGPDAVLARQQRASRGATP
jgi:hypothetical protein